MPIPDFVVVGAPKCGTTALFQFLNEHPELHLPKKEYHHFGRDLRAPTYDGDHWDRATYEALFADARPGQRCGDASVWYLSSKKAAQEMYERNPEMRVIIMLRNPVAMMYSLYNMFIWIRDLTPNGVIDRDTGRVLSFEEDLATQDARKAQLAHELVVPPPPRKGDHRDRIGRRPTRLFHTDVATYSPQVARYLDVFPREQVHVIIHDDLRADSKGTFRDVLRFLGVAEDFVPTFRKVNASRDIKSVTLHRVMRNHDAFPMLRRMMRALVPRPLRKKTFRFIERVNIQTRPQEPMKEETRRWLQDHFRDDVARLSDLLGRDLVSLWYPEEETPPDAPAETDAAEPDAAHPDAAEPGAAGGARLSVSP